MSIAELTTDALKRRRAIELLSDPALSVREISREVGMPESSLRKLKAECDAAKLQLVTLPVASIRLDGGTQTRAAINDAIVNEYAADLAKIVAAVPPVVYSDGTDNWLSSGFHRVIAAIQLDWREIAVELRRGTRRDALRFAFEANSTHGLRLTNADKRRSVELALSDPEWAKQSNALIAEMCRVSPPFVASVREEMERLETVSSEDVRTTADGRAVNVRNIGRKPKPATEDEPEPAATREPGCDDDLGEPETVEVEGDEPTDPDRAYLDSVPLRSKLGPRSLVVFDRDALKHFHAQTWMEAGVNAGLTKYLVGETQGAWEHLASQFLRRPYPHRWLRCSSDGCDDGLTADGSGCPVCYSRGYVIP